jgi:hypothetical protein
VAIAAAGIIPLRGTPMMLVVAGDELGQTTDALQKTCAIK